MLVTSGYGKELAVHLPAGEPVEVLQTISNPNALVSTDALNHLSALMASQPNGEVLLQGLLDTARAALTSALHHGFLLMLGINGAGFGLQFIDWQSQAGRAQARCRGGLGNHLKTLVGWEQLAQVAGGVTIITSLWIL